jgi:hypothetical protein
MLKDKNEVETAVDRGLSQNSSSATSVARIMWKRNGGSLQLK